ncbi:hypothetical protein GIB67_006713 [Kingdonia uniflora]|uniref:V-type proton ATPase subunit S1/VOA1 transmembrane domain-containing protein n=1 Tax=Kingdonia uniflora TaxID=39325 RepID=A0A7J7LYW6_9MAGN|nr:hypothetical protein GIB67_006713 [Kingdonia uniflora]
MDWTTKHSSLYNEMRETVNYRTISQKDLAKSVLSEGGWSKLLCSGEDTQQPMDIALVFVGKELHSSDISMSNHSDPILMNMLEVSFSKSSFSMAFPYVASSEEETMETSLISGFTETCGHGLGNFQKFSDINSVHDYLDSRKEDKQKGKTDLIVFSNGGSDSSEELKHTFSEGEVFSELISSMEKSGASYTVLYASEPYRSISYRALDRFLAESTLGNATFCDGVCQIKSSLLEGLLVGLVLLMILISGLCCMMGIDTPTRFEAAQDS